MQTGVLNVIGGDSLLSFDLNIDVHADRSRNSWFVCTLVCEEDRTVRSFVQLQGDRAGSEKLRDVDSIQLTQIVPDIHLSAQSADLDDGLTKEIIGLPLELLLHAGLDVIILIPNTHLDAVWGVVTFTKETEPKNKPRLPNTGVTLAAGRANPLSYYHDSFDITKWKNGLSTTKGSTWMTQNEFKLFFAICHFFSFHFSLQSNGHCTLFLQGPTHKLNVSSQTGLRLP